MGLDYSTTALLQAIRDESFVTENARDWPDAQLIRKLNRTIEGYLVPFIARARKEHFAAYADLPLVAGQAGYYLPAAATGGKARALQLVDGSGNHYAKLDEETLEYAITQQDGSTGTPSRYHFRGNQVVLRPTPSGSPTLSLRVYHLARPSKLVTAAECIQISALTSATRLSYTGTAPSGYSTSTSVDLVQNTPGFDVLATKAITGTGSGYIDVASYPSTLAVGDWICLTGTAPVVTGAIPELVLECLVKKMVLEVGKGDEAWFRKRLSLLKMAEKEAEVFLRRRNSGESQVANGTLDA